ncbi:hypothetical protein PUN28_002278 [Cardiocondyla obscurior]|uniref:Uncharacterized protein n=1 Tax=Cardiocondyla obscurior TaxID=286306 RepID=A0AAW2GTL1_9HYME
MLNDKSSKVLRCSSVTSTLRYELFLELDAFNIQRKGGGLSVMKDWIETAVMKRRKVKKECRRSETERLKAAKKNRIYLPMRMSCRSDATSPRPVLRSL